MNRTLIFLSLMCCWAETFAADVASASLDLRKFGYHLIGPTSVFVDYTYLGFLSEDLLLISINQRSFGPVERMFADTPESTMVVFDVNRAGVIARGKMSVEKLPDSVQAVSGERFAVLNEKGLQLCDQGLRCGPQVGPAQGPLFVSPQGRRLAVGGNGLSQIQVIDAESLKQVAVFEQRSPQKVFQRGVVISGDVPEQRPPQVVHQVVVAPGDTAMLVSRDSRVTIQRSGMEEVPINIDSKGNFREFRFLNAGLVACLDHDASEVVIIDVDGKQVRRYEVAKAWRTGFLPTASGARFGIYEHGYTLLNSVVNFLDIDAGRPQDFQRVRVVDMSSGDEVSRLEWDPRPHLIKPAISPSGHRIARVRAGILEVFQVN